MRKAGWHSECFYFVWVLPSCITKRESKRVQLNRSGHGVPTEFILFLRPKETILRVSCWIGKLITIKLCKSCEDVCASGNEIVLSVLNLSCLPLAQRLVLRHKNKTVFYTV